MEFILLCVLEAPLADWTKPSTFDGPTSLDRRWLDGSVFPGCGAWDQTRNRERRTLLFSPGGSSYCCGVGRYDSPSINLLRIESLGSRGPRVGHSDGHRYRLRVGRPGSYWKANPFEPESVHVGVGDRRRCGGNPRYSVFLYSSNFCHCFDVGCRTPDASVDCRNPSRPSFCICGPGSFFLGGGIEFWSTRDNRRSDSRTGRPDPAKAKTGGIG